MQASLLKVKSIQVTKFALEAQSGTAEEQSIDCDVKFLRHEKISHAWVIILTISFGATPDTRYAGQISLIGEFETADTVSDAESENLASVNGPAILYSTAREIILSFTSRFPKGQWMLPAVTFIDRKKAKAPVSTEAAIPPTDEKR